MQSYSLVKCATHLSEEPISGEGFSRSHFSRTIDDSDLCVPAENETNSLQNATEEKGNVDTSNTDVEKGEGNKSEGKGSGNGSVSGCGNPRNESKGKQKGEKMKDQIRMLEMRSDYLERDESNEEDDEKDPSNPKERNKEPVILIDKIERCLVVEWYENDVRREQRISYKKYGNDKAKLRAKELIEKLKSGITFEQLYPDKGPPIVKMYEDIGYYKVSLIRDRIEREWRVEWFDNNIPMKARWSCKKVGNEEAQRRADNFAQSLIKGIFNPILLHKATGTRFSRSDRTVVKINVSMNKNAKRRNRSKSVKSDKGTSTWKRGVGKNRSSSGACKKESQEIVEQSMNHFPGCQNYYEYEYPNYTGTSYHQGSFNNTVPYNDKLQYNRSLCNFNSNSIGNMDSNSIELISNGCLPYGNGMNNSYLSLDKYNVNSSHITSNTNLHMLNHVGYKVTDTINNTENGVITSRKKVSLNRSVSPGKGVNSEVTQMSTKMSKLRTAKNVSKANRTSTRDSKKKDTTTSTTNSMSKKRGGSNVKKKEKKDTTLKEINHSEILCSNGKSNNLKKDNNSSRKVSSKEFIFHFMNSNLSNQCYYVSNEGYTNFVNSMPMNEYPDLASFPSVVPPDYPNPSIMYSANQNLCPEETEYMNSYSKDSNYYANQSNIQMNYAPMAKRNFSNGKEPMQVNSGYPPLYVSVGSSSNADLQGGVIKQDEEEQKRNETFGGGKNKNERRTRSPMKVESKSKKKVLRKEEYEEGNSMKCNGGAYIQTYAHSRNTQNQLKNQIPIQRKDVNEKNKIFSKNQRSALEKISTVQEKRNHLKKKQKNEISSTKVIPTTNDFEHGYYTSKIENDPTNYYESTGNYPLYPEDVQHSMYMQPSMVPSVSNRNNVYHPYSEMNETSSVMYDPYISYVNEYNNGSIYQFSNPSSGIYNNYQSNTEPSPHYVNHVSSSAYIPFEKEKNTINNSTSFKSQDSKPLIKNELFRVGTNYLPMGTKHYNMSDSSTYMNNYYVEFVDNPRGYQVAFEHNGKIQYQHFEVPVNATKEFEMQQRRSANEFSLHVLAVGCNVKGSGRKESKLPHFTLPSEWYQGNQHIQNLYNQTSTTSENVGSTKSPKEEGTQEKVNIHKICEGNICDEKNLNDKDILINSMSEVEVSIHPQVQLHCNYQHETTKEDPLKNEDTYTTAVNKTDYYESKEENYSNNAETIINENSQYPSIAAVDSNNMNYQPSKFSYSNNATAVNMMPMGPMVPMNSYGINEMHMLNYENQNFHKMVPTNVNPHYVYMNYPDSTDGIHDANTVNPMNECINYSKNGLASVKEPISINMNISMNMNMNMNPNMNYMQSNEHSPYISLNRNMDLQNYPYLKENKSNNHIINYNKKNGEGSEEVGSIMDPYNSMPIVQNEVFSFNNFYNKNAHCPSIQNGTFEKIQLQNDPSHTEEVNEEMNNYRQKEEEEKIQNSIYVSHDLRNPNESNLLRGQNENNSMVHGNLEEYGMNQNQFLMQCSPEPICSIINNSINKSPQSALFFNERDTHQYTQVYEPNKMEMNLNSNNTDENKQGQHSSYTTPFCQTRFQDNEVHEQGISMSTPTLYTTKQNQINIDNNLGNQNINYSYNSYFNSNRRNTISDDQIFNDYNTFSLYDHSNENSDGNTNEDGEGIKNNSLFSNHNSKKEDILKYDTLQKKSTTTTTASSDFLNTTTHKNIKIGEGQMIYECSSSNKRIKSKHSPSYLL